MSPSIGSSLRNRLSTGHLLHVTSTSLPRAIVRNFKLPFLKLKSFQIFNISQVCKGGTYKGASIYDIRSGWGGRGYPKSRQQEQNQLICDSDRGVKKSEHFADVIYGSPLK